MRYLKGRRSCLRICYDLHINREKYYQTIFYLIFSLIGLKVKAEVKTNKGRIDAVIIDKDIYIFEFKFNGDKDQALNQIKDKKYFEKYQGVGKEIYLFGVAFTDRNIGDWALSTDFDVSLPSHLQPSAFSLQPSAFSLFHLLYPLQ
ncbi:MAG: PD-(D/E)XK nuclease domain-containing protein [Deltaproteobacteria bacterium]|jgi:hypothetical protein|nr:PD-(D/E)XK nuclease domain-containing protein [Deltaproteobacteria bacterium]